MAFTFLIVGVGIFLFEQACLILGRGLSYGCFVGVDDGGRRERNVQIQDMRCGYCSVCVP
jgi:hypothetical protein